MAEAAHKTQGTYNTNHIYRTHAMHGMPEQRHQAVFEHQESRCFGLAHKLLGRASLLAFNMANYKLSIKDTQDIQDLKVRNHHIIGLLMIPYMKKGNT